MADDVPFPTRKLLPKMRPRFGWIYCNWPSNKASIIYAGLPLLKPLNPDFERGAYSFWYQMRLELLVEKNADPADHCRKALQRIARFGVFQAAQEGRAQNHKG